jgi:cyclopropane fatty-acyl-phospholipid synthase-like methyltransferase
MTLRIDPEENEIQALRELTDWRGKRVLEIGCGEGRLSQRLVSESDVEDLILRRNLFPMFVKN